jgi:hypothetical protein
MRKIKNLSFIISYTTRCLGRMFRPTIQLLFQISTTSHPRDEASNPQKRVVSHFPLTTHKTHNPLVFSYNYPYFPQMLFLSNFPTQGMYLFTNISPSSIPFIYRGFSGKGNHDSLSWETQGISLTRKLPPNKNNHLFI